MKKLAYVVLFILFIFSLSKLKNAEFFPITHVKVFGVQHVSRQDMQALIAPLVNQGFFAVNVERIKEKILQFPWVAQVGVSRIWPNQVVVTVNEKKPIALWNDNSVLSVSGELFSPELSTIPADLPQFSGPVGDHILMTQYYSKINNLLMPLHFKITRLELTPALAWIATLNNGVKLNMGHKDILTRIDHFVKVYPKIVGDRVADVEYIDLRYSNGMAIRWKSVT